MKPTSSTCPPWILCYMPPAATYFDTSPKFKDSQNAQILKLLLKKQTTPMCAFETQHIKNTMITAKIALPTDDPIKVAEKNMIFSTDYDLHDAFFCSMYNWLSLNKGYTLLHVEQFFRKNDINIYVIAENPSVPKGHMLKYITEVPHSKTGPFFSATFYRADCREDALHEMMLRGMSYHENYIKLNTTGIISPIKDIEELPRKSSKIEYTENGVIEWSEDRMYDLKYGKIKLMEAVFPPHIHFIKTAEEIYKQTGKTPEIGQIKMEDSLQTYFVLTVDGEPVSHIGLLIETSSVAKNGIRDHEIFEYIVDYTTIEYHGEAK